MMDIEVGVMLGCNRISLGSDGIYALDTHGYSTMGILLCRHLTADV